MQFCGPPSYPLIPPPPLQAGLKRLALAKLRQTKICQGGRKIYENIAFINVRIFTLLGVIFTLLGVIFTLLGVNTQFLPHEKACRKWQNAK